MKAIKFVLGTALLIGFSFPYTVHAVTDTKNATATFNLVSPAAGTLKINSASNLVFDDATIATTASITNTTTSSAISISELSGNAPGWTLQVSLGTFTDGSKTISGAQLFYPTAEMATDTVNPVVGKEPTSVTGDNAFTGASTGKIITSGSAAATIASAKIGSGYGNWTMTYGDANKIQLKIPTGHLAGAYTGTLTYTLMDTPGV